MLNYLFSEPIIFAVWLLAIAYGITVHEFAHAFAAYLEGDHTAKDAGRLTLNPIAHIDLTGLLILVVAGFGWGRPTPVNPNNLKRGKLSDNLVSLAGIFFNLASVVIFGLALKAISVYTALTPDNLLVMFLAFLMQINLMLVIFNLIPIPPLDGSHVLFNILPARFDSFKISLTQNGPWLLLILILADNFLNIGIFSSIFQFFFNLVFKFF